MEYALMTEPQVGGTYDELLRLALWAEGRGLAAFSRSDHYLDMEASEHASDAFATLAGLSRDTERIKLNVLVTPLTFRHPAIIAKTAATIDEMSGGRLELGIGTGWMETEHAQLGMELGELRDRFSRLYETLAYVWAAFGKSNGGFSGRHYQLADIDVRPRPTGDLPLIVGGNGPKKTPSLAGRFADEYNIFSADPATIGPRLEVMRQAAVDAGRDPDAILVSMVVGAYFGGDQADYEEGVGRALAASGRTLADLEARLAERGVPFGPAERLGEWAEHAAAHGIGRLYIQEYKALADIDTERLDRVLDVVLG